MKVKDISISLNIKNFKVGKFLHLYATEAIGDFQKVHPRIIPILMQSLKIGDPRQSLNACVELDNSLNILHQSVKQLRELIEEHMMSEMPEKVEGQGDQFISTSGGMGFSFKAGKEKVTVNPESKKQKSSEPKKKTTRKTATKKAPAKNRATKKKAKKEEE